MTGACYCLALCLVRPDTEELCDRLNIGILYSLMYSLCDAHVIHKCNISSYNSHSAIDIVDERMRYQSLNTTIKKHLAPYPCSVHRNRQELWFHNEPLLINRRYVHKWNFRLNVMQCLFQTIYIRVKLHFDMNVCYYFHMYSIWLNVFLCMLVASHRSCSEL